jgi:hypothetical protein
VIYTYIKLLLYTLKIQKDFCISFVDAKDFCFRLSCGSAIFEMKGLYGKRGCIFWCGEVWEVYPYIQSTFYSYTRYIFTSNFLYRYSTRRWISTHVVYSNVTSTNIVIYTYVRRNCACLYDPHIISLYSNC